MTRTPHLVRSLGPVLASVAPQTGAATALLERDGRHPDWRPGTPSPE